MSLQVWKFPLKNTGHSVVSMPEKSIIVSVQSQRGVVTLWAVCDTERAIDKRGFYVTLTGESLPERYVLKSIGTVLLDGDDFVLHVFEVL